MRKLKYIPVIFASSLAICSCNSGNAQGSAQQPQFLKKTPDLQASSVNDNAVPGSGFVNVFGMPKNFNCFSNAQDTNNIKFSNLSGSVNFDRAISKSDLSSLLNVSVSADFSYSIYSGSANVNYLKETSDSRYSDSFTYAQTYAANATYQIPDNYGNDLLNKIGQGALANGKFGQICGDSFISGSKAGAVLLASVTINFNSAEGKTSFDSSFKAGVMGIASVTAAFKQAVSNKNITATLSVRALQNGGDPSKLAQIFGHPMDKGYAISTCGPDDLDSCSKIISGIIAYAQNDFQNSLDIKNSDAVYYFSPNSAKYSDFGIGFDTTKLTPETKQAITDLNQLYNNDLENKIYLSKYLINLVANPIYKEYIPVSLAGDVGTLINKLGSLLDLSSNALSQCFSTDTDLKCPAFVDNIKKAHQQFKDDGSLNRVYALRTIVQAENQTSGATNSNIRTYIPINSNNNVPVTDTGFGVSPKVAKVVGDYIMLGVYNTNVGYSDQAICQLNFNPDLSIIDPKFKVTNYHIGDDRVLPAEIYCDRGVIIKPDGTKTPFISPEMLSTRLDWVGLVNFDSVNNYYVFGRTSFAGKITSLKAHNNLVYNPI